MTNWVGFSFASPTLTTDGKRLVFLKSNFQTNVYVGGETEGGGHQADHSAAIDL